MKKIIKSIEMKLMLVIKRKDGNFGHTSSQSNEMNKTVYIYDIYLIDKILIAFILGCSLSTCHYVSKTYW